MTLRPICEEFCRIKFLNMFKIFATTLRHLASRGNYESLATVSRLLCDPLAMSVAKQSQSSEIGALENPSYIVS